MNEIKKIDHVNGFLNGNRVKGDYVSYKDIMDSINSVCVDYPAYVFTDCEEIQMPDAVKYGEKEICQWFLTDRAGMELVVALTDDTILYSPCLDAYFWGIDFAGVSFDMIYTNVKNVKGE